MIRAIALAATIAVLLCMWTERDKPPTWLESLTPQVSQVDYCVIDERAAGKDQLGEWHFFWSEGYGPCSLQDRFRNI
jgi:hypothetical protein